MTFCVSGSAQILNLKVNLIFEVGAPLSENCLSRCQGYLRLMAGAVSQNLHPEPRIEVILSDSISGVQFFPLALLVCPFRPHEFDGREFLFQSDETANGIHGGGECTRGQSISQPQS